jgi:hypothetical protein
LLSPLTVASGFCPTLCDELGREGSLRRQVTIDASRLANLQPGRRNANAAGVNREEEALAGAQLELPAHDGRKHKATSIAKPNRDRSWLVVFGRNVGHMESVPHNQRPEPMWEKRHR